MNSNEIDIHVATKLEVPATQTIINWCDLTLTHLQQSDTALSIKIVDHDEIRNLNKDFRQQDKPTNVLSFPFGTEFDMSDSDDNTYLGDIAICAAVVMDEAREQHKTYTAHFAHMVVHGILHLLNFDHTTDTEAAKMEDIEIGLLAELGFDNPYTATHTAVSENDNIAHLNNQENRD